MNKIIFIISITLLVSIGDVSYALKGEDLIEQTQVLDALKKGFYVSEKFPTDEHISYTYNFAQIDRFGDQKYFYIKTLGIHQAEDNIYTVYFTYVKRGQADYKWKDVLFDTLILVKLDTNIWFLKKFDKMIFIRKNGKWEGW